MSLDLYLRLAYYQDDALYIEDDEEGLLDEEYEKLTPEFTSGQLDCLSLVLSALLAYEETSRGTPETVFRSPWFKGCEAEE